MLCALLGAAILVNHKSTGINSDTIGDLYALGSAIFYAAFIICVKNLRKSFAAPTVMFWVSLSGMYILGIIAYFMGRNSSALFITRVVSFNRLSFSCAHFR